MNETRPTDIAPQLYSVASGSWDGTPTSTSPLMGNQATRASQHAQSRRLTVFLEGAVDTLFKIWSCDFFGRKANIHFGAFFSLSGGAFQADSNSLVYGVTPGSF